jgi:hypothetical protein
LGIGEKVNDLVLLLDVAAVMPSHADVPVSERGGNLVVIGSGDALQFSGEGGAQAVQGETRTDQTILLKLGDEIAGLRL